MRPAAVPRVRTFEEFVALNLHGTDLVLVGDAAEPIFACFADRLLPAPATTTPAPPGARVRC